MLFKHYSNLEILNDVEDLDEFIEIYKNVFNEESEQKLFQLYLVNYQHMTKDNFKTFDEWLGRIENKKEIKVKKEKTVEEIFKDVELILKAR